MDSPYRFYNYDAAYRAAEKGISYEEAEAEVNAEMREQCARWEAAMTPAERVARDQRALEYGKLQSRIMARFKATYAADPLPEDDTIGDVK